MVLSFLPGDKFPDITFTLFEIDKIVHFLFYFVLALLMGTAFYYKKNEPFIKRIVIIVAIGISVGFFIEVIQGNFIKNRFFDFFDILANSIGTLVGFIIIEKIRINKLKHW